MRYHLEQICWGMLSLFRLLLSSMSKTYPLRNVAAQNLNRHFSIETCNGIWNGSMLWGLLWSACIPSRIVCAATLNVLKKCVRIFWNHDLLIFLKFEIGLDLAAYAEGKIASLFVCLEDSLALQRYECDCLVSFVLPVYPGLPDTCSNWINRNVCFS